MDGQTPGRLLVINSGSSSLKYAEFAVAGHLLTSADRRSSGIVDRIGESDAHVRHMSPDGSTSTFGADVPDQSAALLAMHDALSRTVDGNATLVAVGHRVVHGADSFKSAVVVDERVESEIDRLSPLAPLHNPANLDGIRSARAAYPGIPQVAVFDTAFHATIPPQAATYAIPTDLATANQIRRWGFQGTSCAYVARAAAGHLAIPIDEIQLIICHLGNGASVTAVRDGKSIDTSMGMTPLEGLVMGTRSGDIDPAVVTHLMDAADMTGYEVLKLLTHRSGMLGLCGDSDMRTVRERADTGDERAVLALSIYTHRIRKYIGAFLTQLPDLAAVVFTAGVGERDPDVRREVLSPLQHVGLRLDERRNAATVRPTNIVRIDDGAGSPALLVIPTDEELEIARQTMQLLDTHTS